MIAKSHRLRVGRNSETGGIYLVTANVMNRQPVFSDWRLGRLVVSEFKRAQEQEHAASVVWVVMPDHFHWLFELRSGSLAELMCRTKSLSTLAVNAAQQYSGRLWQPGFHDRAVRREEDLKKIARYVIANPLRVGLVRRIGEYPLWDAAWL